MRMSRATGACCARRWAAEAAFLLPCSSCFTTNHLTGPPGCHLRHIACHMVVQPCRGASPHKHITALPQNPRAASALVTFPAPKPPAPVPCRCCQGLAAGEVVARVPLRLAITDVEEEEGLHIAWSQPVSSGGAQGEGQAGGE
jgi:hypothetical protein